MHLFNYLEDRGTYRYDKHLASNVRIVRNQVQCPITAVRFQTKLECVDTDEWNSGECQISLTI
jgi:hypothetical protein